MNKEYCLILLDVSAFQVPHLPPVTPGRGGACFCCWKRRQFGLPTRPLLITLWLGGIKAPVYYSRHVLHWHQRGLADKPCYCLVGGESLGLIWYQPREQGRASLTAGWGQGSPNGLHWPFGVGLGLLSPEKECICAGGRHYHPMGWKLQLPLALSDTARAGVGLGHLA